MAFHYNITLHKRCSKHDSGVEGAQGKSSSDHLDFQLTSESLQAILEHQRNLEASLSALRIGLIQSDATNKSGLERHLNAAEASAKAAGNGLDDLCWDLLPIDLRRTEQSSIVATRVFETTELMEHVYSYLQVDDALVCQQVNRCMRDTLAGSVSLQKRFGLVPDFTADFFSPFTYTCSSYHKDKTGPCTAHHTIFDSIEMDDSKGTFSPSGISPDPYFDASIQPNPPDNEVEYSFWWDCEKLDRKRGLGIACRKLLLTQPPPKDLWYSIYDEDLVIMQEDILEPSGDYVTLGDVYDLVVDAMAHYRSREGADRGLGVHCVRFEGQGIVLRKDDRLMKQRWRKYEEQFAEYEAYWHEREHGDDEESLGDEEL